MIIMLRLLNIALKTDLLLVIKIATAVPEADIVAGLLESLNCLL